MAALSWSVKPEKFTCLHVCRKIFSCLPITGKSTWLSSSIADPSSSMLAAVEIRCNKCAENLELILWYWLLPLLSLVVGGDIQEQWLSRLVSGAIGVCWSSLALSSEHSFNLLTAIRRFFRSLTYWCNADTECKSLLFYLYLSFLSPTPLISASYYAPHEITSDILSWFNSWVWHQLTSLSWNS